MKVDLKGIRETQKKLRSLNDDEWCDLYAKRAKTKRRSISTIWYWENKTRQPDVRYLRFLCEEFNYNPAFILGLVDEPEFTTKHKESEFPELNRIIKAFDDFPALVLATRKIMREKSPDYLHKMYLEAFSTYPDLYVEVLEIIKMFEAHPELFQNNGA